MLKKKKTSNDRGRTYPILDQIFIEYDKDFRKTFLFSEFQDNLALKEVLQELKETNEEKFIKISYDKNNFTLTNYAIRYLRTIYAEYNRYEINHNLNITSLLISILAMILSLVTSFINILEIDSILSKWILFIMLCIFMFVYTYKFFKVFN